MNQPDPKAIKQDLTTLGQARIYWGHQSVGENLLDGLRMLARDTQTDLNVVDGAPSAAGPWFESVPIGKNGDPASKARDFAMRLSDRNRPAPDVALMKFCYVDFKPQTDVETVLSAYRDAVTQVRNSSPGVTLIHVTAPLTTLDQTLKDRAKRLLGVKPWDDASNIKRHTYNDRLRAEYGNELVFDIAVLESTRPDGTRVTFEADGKTYPALYEGYTDDGGHLNDAGKRYIAGAFASTVATALREAAPSAPQDASVGTQ